MCNKNMRFVNLPLCIVALLITVIEGLPPCHQSAVQWEAPREECLHPYPAPGCPDSECYLTETQGPCDEGQIFSRVPKTIDTAMLRGGALGTNAARVCSFIQSHNNATDESQTNFGYCKWNDPDHLCYGQPASQRYSNETNRCHTIGLQEYCPQNQVFYEHVSRSFDGYSIREELSRTYGECDCFPLHELWYDTNDGHCYPPHSQGSCPEGQWLTLSSEEERLICEKAPCPADGVHLFWTEGHKKCYLRGEKGPCASRESSDFQNTQSDVLAVKEHRPTCAIPENTFGGTTSYYGRTCYDGFYTSSKSMQDKSQCPKQYRGSVSQCGRATYSKILRKCTYDRVTLELAGIRNPPPPPQDEDPEKCLLPHPDWGCVNPLCYHVGTQGPCNDGQIFKKIPENFDVRQLRGGALGKTCGSYYAEDTNFRYAVDLNLDVNNTYPPLTNPGQSYGYCIWNDTKHPCNGLPANQRYSNETKRCHTLGLQEYCPANQTFYTRSHISEGMIYGSCDCYPLFEMWYDPNDGNCYPPHSQGSCPPGQWLTIKWKDGPVVCEPAPCPADGKHVYWTEGHQQCYLRGERGPCAESRLEEVLGFLFGILGCVTFKIGPTITTRSPTRHCSDIWQTASKMIQVSEDCDRLRPVYESSSLYTNRCGEATYSRTLKRCVSSY